MAFSSEIKDIKLAEKGRKRFLWSSRFMPVLDKIARRFSKIKPFEGVKIGACLHITVETAALVKALQKGGAQVFLTASNPLSTQDDIAAFLMEEGVCVYGWRGESEEDYKRHIKKVAEADVDFIIDDGGDLTVALHETGKRVKFGQEETTTGVIRIRNLEKKERLLFPVFAVNNALTKYLFDNRYGTGQSTLEGIMRAAHILLAGKTVVVAGYGWCGRGIAVRARGLGARVIVTEVNPVRALEAVMDGFEVMPMDKAACVGDVFITATGNIEVIDVPHFRLMKDGAILANAGHFDVEINVKSLYQMADEIVRVSELIEEIRFGDKRVYLLTKGRLVNLSAASGHPPEVMDMSFANQALVAQYGISSKELPVRVLPVPSHIEEEVARLKLESMGISIDSLTPSQREYLEGWK